MAARPGLDPSHLSWRRASAAGAIPAEIGIFSSLRALILHGNRITGELRSMPPPALPHESTLNTCAGSIPEEIGNLTGLASLVLDSNKLTGPIPASIGNLTGLASLRLDSNKLTGAWYHRATPASLAVG